MTELQSPLSGRASAPPGLDLARPAGSADRDNIIRAAQAFEAAFLAEMLKHSGLGKSPDGFGGGQGEEQFASMLHEAHAREIVAAGGIGLAEYIVTALEEGQR